MHIFYYNQMANKLQLLVHYMQCKQTWSNH